MKRVRMLAIAGSLVALVAAGFAVPAPDAPSATGSASEAATSAAATSATAPAAAPAARSSVAPAARSAPRPARVPERVLDSFTGSASYYADRFEGRTTASGVAFRQAKPWAAHRTLPFGTRLRVTNVANGEQVEVKVVDRGPFAHGRILDLSKSAARELGFLRAGHTRVKVEVIERP